MRKTEKQREREGEREIEALIRTKGKKTEFARRIPSLDNPPPNAWGQEIALAHPFWEALTIRNFFLIVKSGGKGWTGWEQKANYLGWVQFETSKVKKV